MSDQVRYFPLFPGDLPENGGWNPIDVSEHWDLPSEVLLADVEDLNAWFCS